MNAQPDVRQLANPPSRAEKLLTSATGPLAAFVEHQAPLRAALHTIEALGDVPTIKAASKQLRQLVQFEPSVTMIGQIKSGKTTLVNALIGWNDLLPADVNPWTSVVTSLHLCPRELTPPARAKFRFFDEAEWTQLMKGGGRIGELAGRAGADDELSAIMEQAEQMREKAKARLGRKFEMLLGGEQSYGYIDKSLVERYVCLGDDTQATQKAARAQGTFADITRSADLYMQQPAYPINICIRDTPGVNDTFLVREQITIKAIRDSRICVVVLSAHQALSSTDLALIRLISNVKSRQVLIFINRIDELSDPVEQIPQIRDSILRTLKDKNGPADAEIVFGSALWAQAAASGGRRKLPPASLAAFAKLMPGCEADDHTALWQASGIPALIGAAADRVAEGEGAELLGRIAANTRNLLTSVKVIDNLDAKSKVASTELALPADKIKARLNDIQTQALAKLETTFTELGKALTDRARRSHQSFLDRATTALAKHLEVYGENSPWSYEPAGLRILLNTAYKSYGARMQSAYTQCAKEAASDLKQLCTQALSLDDGLYDPMAPPAPHVPPPVTLGQTIALDLRGGWWKGWWLRRQSYETQARRFHDLIADETAGLVDALTQDLAAELAQAMRILLSGFLDEQRDAILSVTAAASGTQVRTDKVFGLEELERRNHQITKAQAQTEIYLQ